MTNKSGTIRYHDAVLDKLPREKPWAVQFVDGGQWLPFTLAEGEAMGLTPQEPAPLVVTCNGHSIELSDEEAEMAERVWSTYEDDQSSFVHAPLNRVKHKLAGLLRDARQDPQPASEPLPVAPMIIGPDEYRPGWSEHEWQSPPTYPQPEQDDTPGIDFDALPDGTVIRDKWGDLHLREGTGWFNGSDYLPWCELHDPCTVVYQPAAPSPGECLRGLLAGHGHADELIDALARFSRGGSYLPVSVVTAVIDAAREVHGG